jgi:tetratricopeptide (TPR) repeat protein
MSNVAKLKKQAAELEQKKQFDKALAVYVKLLESFDEHASELDVALFNRVGDLMLRQGNVADAVDYYEKAVDRYSDTGFFNNAIALCNKILRHSPGRASVYYKLGKSSALKGFKSDAKVNFLEYADRMQKAGKTDEAFRALKEFADLCPDQDEIRLMLADQLTKNNRGAEAVEQLQILYARYEAEGRAGEAAATAERIHAIDPTVELRADGGGPQVSSGSDLVFLDLDEPAAAPPPRKSTAIPARPSTPPPAETPSIPLIEVPVMEAPITRADIAIETASSLTLDAPLSGITRVDDDALGLEQAGSDSLLGLESTQLDDAASPPAVADGSLLDLEPTSFGEPPAVHQSTSQTHIPERDDALDVGLELTIPPVAEPTTPPRPSIEFDASTLTTPDLAQAPVPASRPTPNTSRVALEGLPLMDLDVPTPAPARPSQAIDSSTLSDDLGLIDSEVSFGSAAEPVPAMDSPLDLNVESLTVEEPTEEEDDEDSAVLMPTPSIARKSTMVALQSVEILQASVEGEPENWSLRRELAEAMLDAGDRAGGIKELETAMNGAERSGDLDFASTLAEEVARLEPDSVKYHQKRVELAFRTNDRPRLIEAYISLGDALLRSEQADKARSIYQRVIDLAPDEPRATAALEAIVVPEPAPAPPARTSSAQRRSTIAQPVVEAQPEAQSSSDFVNLGDWLRDDEGPKDTRMIVAEEEPTGDEDADFADMLKKFKQGVAENVEATDYQSHYDLAIAFKEMGLLDEAIGEFQKALGGPVNRVPTYEALGQCFLDKGQPKLASSILSRALHENAPEDKLVGVLYLLGRAAEEQGKASEALAFYQRVFVVDIQFRDITDRMTELEKVAQ